MSGPRIGEAAFYRIKLHRCEEEKAELLEALKALTSALEGFEWHSDMPADEFHAMLNEATGVINKVEGVA